MPLLDLLTLQCCLAYRFHLSSSFDFVFHLFFSLWSSALSLIELRLVSLRTCHQVTSGMVTDAGCWSFIVVVLSSLQWFPHLPLRFDFIFHLFFSSGAGFVLIELSSGFTWGEILLTRYFGIDTVGSFICGAALPMILPGFLFRLILSSICFSLELSALLSLIELSSVS